MKIKFTSDLVVNAILGIALGFILLIWWLSFYMSSTVFNRHITYESDVAVVNYLKPIDERISDSIPYYLHQRLQDSISQLRTLRNGDGPSAGAGVTFYFWGTHDSQYCDTCSIGYHKGDWPSKFPIFDKPTRRYLILKGWTLKHGHPGLDSIQFHVEHGQAYVRKQVLDTSLGKNGRAEKIAHMRDVKVPFAYNKEFDCIAIPISAHAKKIIHTTLMITALLGAIYFMFFIAGGFIKFLIDVSRGQTFTNKNIRRLKIIGISLIAIEGLMLSLNFCMPFIFHAYFTDDVVLSEKSWDGAWEWFVAGIAFLLLYKAFRNGKKIKDEQDLVI